MRRALIAAVLAGLLLGPLPQSAAEVIAAPRLPLEPWMAVVPWVLLGLFVALLAVRGRAVRRRGNAFVIMRGRVQCPECEYLLDLDDRHCARCGTAIVQVKRREKCAKCRARNWEDDKFCRQCGTALVVDTAPPEEGSSTHA